MQLLTCISTCFLILNIPVQAEPSSCYYCHSDADGDACHSPIAKESVRIQHCESTTISDYNAKAETVPREDSTSTYVCATLNYTSFANTYVTIRECQYRFIEGQDLCTYLYEHAITPTYSRNFSCQICADDLCNHGHDGNHSKRAHLSFLACIGLFISMIITSIP
ncbi:hypothetical protein NQ315_001284 [Exocentrus adspersus]|uniref:Protein sleepless n=1 Tax=Exocentrus adspersus TaxID=1586481 RepID=A0AAV8WEW7_9CUCU|nr:hypothetical protein NQ315_001284 [Exocentrus adspersus]